MSDMERFLQQVVARNPAEPEFHQAVREVVESIWPVGERTPRYRAGKVLERMRSTSTSFSTGRSSTRRYQRR